MKIIMLSRRALLFAALCFSAAIITALAVAPAAVTASGTKRQLPIYCVQREYKAVSLTFDAAWGNEDTNKLIDILGSYRVKATFFVVGDWARKYPESVKALFDAGHEVMSHSDKHKHMTRLTREEITADINTSRDAIEAVTGTRPTLFRAPYGEYDDKLITTLRSMEMETIQWDVDSLDWKDLSAQEIQKRVLSKVKAGSIVLFHNAALHTPEALPGIIEALLRDSYQIVPVSQLIHKGDYEMDHTGMQVPKKTSAQ